VATYASISMGNGLTAYVPDASGRAVEDYSLCLTKELLFPIPALIPSDFVVRDLSYATATSRPFPAASS
jgi:hypothetical protein